MRNKIYLVALTAIVALSACKQKDNKDVLSDNPFFVEWNTPFEVPPFDKIKNEHYMPAFKKGMEEHNAEIKAIIENKEAPTFENTIEAMEFSGSLLTKVSDVFFNITSANTSDEIEKIAEEISPLLSEHFDNINLNDILFKRVETVYNQKKSLKLNAEQATLLEETYKDFIRGGAALDSIKKNRLKEVNKELSGLELKFGQNKLNETNNFKLVIEKKEDLAGLPQSSIDAAAIAAKEANIEGKWVFTLHNPSAIPFLQYCANRDLRKKMFDAYSNVGNNNNANDNKEIIKKIVKLRQEKANLLGFENFAAYSLNNVMAKNPKNVFDLLHKLWTPALKIAKTEEAQLQTMMNKDNVKGKIEAWDWRYYAEKLRKEKYNLDEEELRPYFELNNVKKGIFEVSTKLFGLKFIERKDIPTYHNEATAYEVQDSKGNTTGILYLDFFPRASKKSGAWMNNFRGQYKRNGKNTIPVVTIVCNFSKPTGDKPALLTYEEVSTFFHEFGHGLHGLLSDCQYLSISGTSVPRDFVELPSQIMENWAGEREVLNMYAKHYKTGEVIPQALIEKMEKSQSFNQGFATVEYLAASLLDMHYHTVKDVNNLDVIKFENDILNQLGLIKSIISRYRSTYFAHIFGGGYSAGYYSYIWAEVLDADAFQAFKEKGIFDKTTADSFKNNILKNGGTIEAMTMYRNFRGAEPTIEPLLKRKGLAISKK